LLNPIGFNGHFALDAWISPLIRNLTRSSLDFSSIRQTIEKPASERLMENVHPADSCGTKFRGMRRTSKYAAVTRDEGNAANGRFPAASGYYLK